MAGKKKGSEPVIEIRNGGWIRYSDDDWPSGIFLRFEPREEVLAIAEMFIPDGVTPAAMRRLKLGRIEAQVNAPLGRDFLIAKLKKPAPDPGRSLEKHFEGTSRARDEALKQGPVDLKLGVPTSPPYPKDFYQRVATAYTEAARRSHRPAVEIAAANRVEPSKVHDWIKYARQKGYLGPGRRGKAG